MLIIDTGGIVLEENKTGIEEYIEKFKGYTYTRKSLLFILWAAIIAVIGLLFLVDWQTYRFGIFLEVLAGTIAVIALDYLVAKEFEFIANEKGYEGKRYFWYSFILGSIGYILVIALPKK